MNFASRALLRADVKPAEAFRSKPYLDCCGKYWRLCACQIKGRLTIGYGRNLDDVGVSELESEVLLDHDLYSAETQAARAFDWFASLSELRQRAITELVFNMGLLKFRGFHRTIEALKEKQFKAAATHLLDSVWKTQVGETRSGRIARYLRDG